MQAQAQTFQAQYLDAINAFCNELDAYLKTGVLPVLVDTYMGVQTFHVHKPLLITTPCGDRKITCKVVRVPEGFGHMIGQHHSISLLL